LGAPVRAPTHGRIVAARRATQGDSSLSFVLIRHDLEVDGANITFYTLLAHLALPDPDSPEARAVPWMESARREHADALAALRAGKVAYLDQRVEAGDLVGAVGTVSRGPEEGPEVHFEIFTTDKLPGDFGRSFRYVNAVSDGPVVRRADVITMI